MFSPGNLANHSPAAVGDLWRAIRDLERALQEQATANILQAAQFGSGGILVTDNGSITIQGTGSLNVGSGALNSAGSIAAGTTITAGGNITSTGGNVTASGQVGGGTLSISSTGSVGGNLSVGGLSTGGSISASGSVAGGTGTFNGGLFSTAVYSTVVSGTRTATWTQNDGTMGTAPSSIRFNTNVVDVAWDDARVEAILGAQAKYYQYKAELAKRDDPNAPNYVGPDYHVHTEVGYIAEDLHSAGLWEVVIYERNEDGSPKLDDAGQVIPFGVHYELLGIYALEAAAWLWGKLQAQQADIDAIKAHLGM
jgi:hypothetical protein